MPIGIQRLNAKTSQPNSLIVFIKPLKGPDEAIAKDFLERIAAQCYSGDRNSEDHLHVNKNNLLKNMINEKIVPIMREHHISIMSLEEYEPNREFVGRNFNAGEVIQLVLKSPTSGRWLPFHYVQMVMMHELAHCKQMNHSRAFWAVRNQYAEQMRVLWSRDYTGEGLWGRGALLGTGQFESNMLRPDDALPKHLCGGTYQSRRRKRKTKKEPLSYQEQKQRRILKKFGANGVALGEDVDIKAELEKGARGKTAAKPRVAGSKRGRELRAAAALARFDVTKKGAEEEEYGKDDEKSIKEETKVKIEDIDDNESTSEDDDDDDDFQSIEIDVNGKRLVDTKGNRMTKVCEDEDPKDSDAQMELRELQESMGLGSYARSDETKIKCEGNTSSEPPPSDPSPRPRSSLAGSTGTERKYEELQQQPKDRKAIKPEPKPRNTGSIPRFTSKSENSPTHSQAIIHEQSSRQHGGGASDMNGNKSGMCPMCSVDNDSDSATCAVCAHVLDPARVPGSWRCKSKLCRESSYLNAGDSGLCGVCGERKASYSTC